MAGMLAFEDCGRFQMSFYVFLLQKKDYKATSLYTLSQKSYWRKWDFWLHKVKVASIEDQFYRFAKNKSKIAEVSITVVHKYCNYWIF